MLLQMHRKGYINSLSNDKFLDWSKLNAFADNIKVLSVLYSVVTGWLSNVDISKISRTHNFCRIISKIYKYDE